VAVFPVQARSPSYHPGDIRVLELVSVDELKVLKDVLVFPVRGPRPHADECSGGAWTGCGERQIGVTLVGLGRH